MGRVVNNSGVCTHLAFCPRSFYSAAAAYPRRLYLRSLNWNLLHPRGVDWQLLTQSQSQDGRNGSRKEYGI